MVYNAFKKIRKYGKFLKTRRNGSYKYLLMSDDVTGPILLNTVEEGVKSSDTYFVMYKNRGFVEESKIMSFTIRTTDNFYIPLDRGTSIDYAVDIDWGDGEKSTIGNGVISESDLLHTYSKPGDYVITIFSESEVIPQLNFGFNSKYGSNDKLISFNSSLIRFDDQSLFAFALNCNNLINIPKNFLKYNPGVTDFRSAFSNCTSLIRLPDDFFNYTVSNNLWTSSTFSHCTHLEYISESLLSNVLCSNISSMFEGCVNLKTHINVNTFFNDNQRTNIDIPRMFYNCKNTTGNALEFQERFGATNNSKGALYNCVKWEGYSEVDKTLIYGDYQIENGKLLWANSNLYLQSSGTQYIDTSVPSSFTTLKVETKFMETEYLSTEVGFFGGKSSGNTQAPTLYHPYRSTSFCSWCGSGTSYTMTKSYSLNTKYDLMASFDGAKGRTWSLNGVSGSSATIANNARNNPGNLAIFADGSGPVYFFAGRIYRFKIERNGEKVRYLVPVPQGLQIGDFTVPSNGMFDVVEQKFYGNAGTGTFTYGSDN